MSEQSWSRMVSGKAGRNARKQNRRATRRAGVRKHKKGPPSGKQDEYKRDKWESHYE